MFKFISIGFKQHSALASFIWGMCTTYIGFARFMAIIFYVKSPLCTILYSLLPAVTMGAGIVTHGEVWRGHWHALCGCRRLDSIFSNVLWGSWLIQQSLLRSQRGARHEGDVVFKLNVIWATLFLSFVIKFNAAGRHPQDFLQRIRYGILDSCDGLPFGILLAHAVPWRGWFMDRNSVL